MVIGKFHSEHAIQDKNLRSVVVEIVDEYFEKQKVTGDSLRQLKVKVNEVVNDYRKRNKSGSNKASSVKGSSASKKDLQQRNIEESVQAEDKKCQKSNSKLSASSSKTSESSSLASKSVYQVEGDDEDEWATLVKFDT